MSASEPTPGPWEWRAHRSAKRAYLIALHGMRPYVMDFVRWGMDGAQPRFRDGERDVMIPCEKGGLWVIPEPHNDYMVSGIDHPDARLIKAAPDLLAACRAALNEELNSSETMRLIEKAVAKAEGRL